MSPSYGPSWNWGPAGRRRGAPVNPNLRVSDADRAAVADRLSRHYGDGRLDQAEFNERLERAMNAKTQADLSGLLDDLPPDQPAADVTHQRPARRHHPILFLLLAVVLLSAAWHFMFQPFYFFPFFLPVPWLLLGVIAFLLLRRRGSWRYRGGQGPQ